VKSKLLRRQIWRVKNQCCVVCGRTRPSKIVMICTKCKEKKNA